MKQQTPALGTTDRCRSAATILSNDDKIKQLEAKIEALTKALNDLQTWRTDVVNKWLQYLRDRV
jgi:hypothetical protein